MKLTSIALGLQFESARCYMFLCLTPKLQPLRGITALVHTDNLEVLLFIIHSFYIALFTALRRTLCTCRMWFWMSDCMLSWCVLLISTEMVFWYRSGWLLHGWCHVKCCCLGTGSGYIQPPCTRSRSKRPLFSFCISGLEYWGGWGGGGEFMKKLD